MRRGAGDVGVKEPTCWLPKLENRSRDEKSEKSKKDAENRGFISFFILIQDHFKNFDGAFCFSVYTKAFIKAQNHQLYVSKLQCSCLILLEKTVRVAVA